MGHLGLEIENQGLDITLTFTNESITIGLSEFFISIKTVLFHFLE